MTASSYTLPTGVKPPFPYFGGKLRAALLIWQRFGIVQNYVAPFAGSLAVELNAPYAVPIMTLNDLDGLLIKERGFYNPQFSRLHGWCDIIPLRKVGIKDDAHGGLKVISHFFAGLVDGIKNGDMHL